jgi:hypothetical protein
MDSLTTYARRWSVRRTLLSSMEEKMVGPKTLPPRRRSLGYLRMVASILAFASLAACATPGRSALAPSPAAAQVVVHNYNWDRLTVYLTRRGSSWRLGAIDAFGEAKFVVPHAALAVAEEVYLVARPIAGRPFRSEAFVFSVGGTADWTIQNQVALSSVMVR